MTFAFSPCKFGCGGKDYILAPIDNVINVSNTNENYLSGGPTLKNEKKKKNHRVLSPI